MHICRKQTYANKKAFIAMKRVLVSCSTHDAAHYVEVLEKLHIQVVVSDEIEDVNLFDGLLLPGGGDISPIFYHRKNRGSTNICISEDIIQLLLFHRFIEQKKPVLGICKGMQLINVALGGTLVQNLPTAQAHAWNNGDQLHNTAISKGSILSSLYPGTIITNSAHHQAVCTLGNHLKATQHAHDGVIEGIEHKFLPILGVQWHPERLCDISSFPASRHICNKPFPTNVGNGLRIFEWFSSVL